MPSAPTFSPRAAGASRLDGLDLLKALAAISVVLIHAAPRDGDFYLEHVNAGLLRLGVPLFLGISGYLAARSSLSRARFREYFWRFLRLHILWALVYWALAYSQGATGVPTSLRAVAVRFADGAYPGQYYFVILLQTYALCAVLPDRRGHHFCGSRGSLLLGVIASGLSLTLHAVLLRGPLGLPPWLEAVLSSANGLWLWWIFFAAGAFAGQREREGVWPMGSAASAAGAALACVVAFTAVPEFPPAGDFSYAPYARVTVQVASVLLVLSLPGLAGGVAPSPLRLLGQRSFGVFVLNPALLYGLSLLVAPAVEWPQACIQAGLVLLAAYGLTPLFERFIPWSMR